MGMACHSSGGLLATAGADKKVCVWDVDGGFCTHFFKGHQGVVTSITFHPDLNRLIAMMKDPFAKYVVQKVSETCDDQTWELILSHIRIHLAILKRYAYGKHIVARVEKLITAEESLIGFQSNSS